MRKWLSLTVLLLSGLWAAATPATDAARGVVERTFGFFPKQVRFKEIPKAGDCDRYALQVRRGVLTVEGSSSVALCKGFHDYIRENGYGINSWTGNRLDLPRRLPAMAHREVVSPYRHHLFFNVCTFGYTMGLWGWNEWEKMIDWLALHGFDMPLSPTGSDAIMARTWKKLGLSDEEIAWYFTAPIHFPWMRMGNLSHFEGGISREWMDAQIALEHRIVDRERALGMTPVFQGFAGFVPPAYEQHFPGTKVTRTDWSHFEGDECNHMLSPLDPMFARTGTLYVQEWEKEFGTGSHYLIDSFNEMDIPFYGDERLKMLREYGKTIYESLTAASPDAVWVMQGWMLGYQRHLWNPSTYGALVSQVPDDRILVLDLGVDFNKYVWKNTWNWDYYEGFLGKSWLWSTVPNFGGRTALVGDLDFYLNEHLTALSSPNRGNLVGYGSSPEGLENNEIVYEVIAEAGWKSDRRDLRDFLHRYTAARYGACPPELETFWEELLQTSYNHFTQNGRFDWQRTPPYNRRNEQNINPHYFKAIRSFLAAREALGDNPLYEQDAISYTALYLAALADIPLREMYRAIDLGAYDAVEDLHALVTEILTTADGVLENHSLLRMQRWLDQAEAQGTSPSEKTKLRLDAKRQVSTWGGRGLDDYSCRVWSGLIRDYYLPRIHYYVRHALRGTAFDVWQFARSEFPVTPSLSDPSPVSLDEAVAGLDGFDRLVAELCPVRHDAADILSKDPAVFRVLQWNVYNFSKFKENSLPDAVALVQEYGADAVSLGGLDSCNVRHHTCQLDDFTALCGGWNGRFQRTMAYRDGAFGLGLATPHPVLSSDGGVLPKGALGKEDRGWVMMELERCTLVGASLDGNKYARREQAARLTEAVKARCNPSKPVILCLDANAYDQDKVFDVLGKDWKRVSAYRPNTPQETRTKCIDYLFVLKDAPQPQVVKSYVCSVSQTVDPDMISARDAIFVDFVL